LASWQLEQLPVTPLWICTLVGAGVAKALPGALLVADAGMSPDGVVPRWQFSQVVDVGMCEFAPAGEVGGMTTILLTPAKLEPVIDGPWQPAQLLLMPLWLISEPLNLAPLPTGVAAMLDPAPTWQVSHAALVGRWLLGRPTMEKPMAGIAKLAAAEPWHCAQLAVVLGALAWMLASVGITAKSVDVWQVLHCADAANGMWFDGTTCALK
jgi:hypothetical protein